MSVSGLLLKTRKERRARSAGQLRDGDGASAPSTSSTLRDRSSRERKVLLLMATRVNVGVNRIRWKVGENTLPRE